MADREAEVMDDGKSIENNVNSGESKVDSTMTDPNAEMVEKMDVDNVEDQNCKMDATENQSSVEVSEPVKGSESLSVPDVVNNSINPSEIRPEDFQVMQNNPVKEKVLVQSNGKKEEFSHTNGNEESQCSIDERSEESQNCYCGGERNFKKVELQCGGCSKWFHEDCISYPIGKCVPFMTYYSFYCKLCYSSGENFSKKQPSFSQMCGTAIANLMQQSKADGKERSMFSKDKEVIPYIVSNWESLTPMQRRIKQTWHNTVHKAVLKDTDVFLCDERGPDGPMFGLVNQDLAKIGPSYDAASRGPQRLNIDSSSSQGNFGGPKGRSNKRKFFDGQMTGAGKKVKSDLVMPKLPPNGYPVEHPFNKDGYRYILAEPDPHAPFRQEFDEGQDWAGKPIPGWLYRKLTPSNVLIALHDRAPQLKVSEDRLSITGEKGYCMARATHGVNRGTWYFECTIDEMPEGAATRLGWSRALANLQGPLGYDKFSYSWRSRKGTKFHESKGYHYADEGYGQGDTLGFLMYLPKSSGTIPLPQIYKDKPLVKFKSYLYYEEKDELQFELKNMKPLPKSKIVFYKNGKSFGTAFENINAGTYYPAVSLYKNCTVSFNFGPAFKYPPKEDAKPVYNLAHDATIEQAMTDLLFFTENKGKLRLDNL